MAPRATPRSATKAAGKKAPAKKAPAKKAPAKTTPAKTAAGKKASVNKSPAKQAVSRGRASVPRGERLGVPGTGVLVTGGGSGIGRETALALAEVGRPVAVWDVDAEGAEETATLCRDRHGSGAHWAG